MSENLTKQPDKVDNITSEYILRMPERCQPCPAVVSGCSQAAIEAFFGKKPSLVRIKQLTDTCPDGAINLNEAESYPFECSRDNQKVKD